MEKDFGLDVIKRADEVIKKSHEFLQSNETVCACYLYKFLETCDINYFNNYKSIYDKLDDKGKLETQKIFITFVNSNYRDLKQKQKKLKK